MFGKFRTVNPLREDFEKLGLLKESKSTPVAPKVEAPIVEDIDEEIEETEELSEDAELTERLKVQRLKRRPASVRSKARLKRRKVKSKLNRKRRMKMRKSGVKRKMKRLKKMKRGRKAGIRKRFQLTMGLEKFNSIIENLIAFKSKLSESTGADDVLKALESVMTLSKTMADRFEDVEDYMENLEMLALAEELIELDDLIEGCDSEDDEDMDDEDDSEEDDSDDDEDMEEAVVVSTVALGAEAVASEDESEEDEVHMGDEMMAVHQESLTTMDKLKKSVITPADAAATLDDMVKYLAGAMQMYIDLAKEMKPDGVDSSQYIGKGAPPAAPAKLPADTDPKEYEGQEQPDMNKVAPVAVSGKA